eukprot:TRINITY_DN5110_c0_g1_i1.p1 TRINITY_DN5110_c0_g1~~TRINITY_DN5110_c0_g1_i1.p1  ORF type:complete len:1052 (-),score=297.05 TRINITY_DN5110_c0_g1_i1:56-3166(-)
MPSYSSSGTYDNAKYYKRKGAKRCTGAGVFISAVIFFLVWSYMKVDTYTFATGPATDFCRAGKFEVQPGYTPTTTFDPQHPDYSLTPIASSRPKYWYISEHKHSSTKNGKAEGRPVVSVVVYTRDSDTGLQDTMESLFAQTLQNIEIIIVDDASDKPESRAALQEFARLPHVRLLKVPVSAKGRGAAYNAAMINARGEYVFILDSQNMLEPTCLEVFAWHLSTNPALGFVKGYTVAYDARNFLHTGSFADRSMFRTRNQVTNAAMIRRTVLAQLGGFDREVTAPGMAGWDLWMRCAEAGIWGTTLPLYMDWMHVQGQSYGADDKGSIVYKGEMNTVEFMERYPRLQGGQWPRAAPSPSMAGSAFERDRLQDTPPFPNRLMKEVPHAMMIVETLDSSNEIGSANLESVKQMVKRGWQVTIVDVSPSSGNVSFVPFSSLTPDTLSLSQFIQIGDYPRFLRYLMESRQPDFVFLSGSEFALQILPFLKACGQMMSYQPAFVGYVHMVEPVHAHLVDASRSMLDLTLVSTNAQLSLFEDDSGDNQLGRLMLRVLKDKKIPEVGWRGRSEPRPSRAWSENLVVRVNAGIDSSASRSDFARRASVRASLGVSAQSPLVWLLDASPAGFSGSLLEALKDEDEPFVAVVSPHMPPFHHAPHAHSSSAMGASETWPEFIDRIDLVNTIYTTNTTMADMLATADVVVIPPGMPFGPVLQAMAGSLVVVAAKGDPVAEFLVDQDTGILVEVSDADIVSRVQVALAQHADSSVSGEGSMEDSADEEHALHQAIREEYVQQYSIGIRKLLKSKSSVSTIGKSARDVVTSRYSADVMGQRFVQALCSPLTQSRLAKPRIPLEVGLEGAARGVEHSLLLARTYELTRRNAAQDKTILSMTQDDKKKENSLREVIEKVRMRETEILELQDDLRARENDIQDAQKSASEQAERIQTLEKELDEVKEHTDKHNKKDKTYHEGAENVWREYTALIKSHDELQAERDSLEKRLSRTASDLDKCTDKHSKKLKTLDAFLHDATEAEAEAGASHHVSV